MTSSDSERPTRLVLYVAGATARSRRAIENLNQLAKKHYGKLDLEIVDIYQQPQRTRDHSVLVAPTLVREWPQPARTLVGDLSDRERVLKALDLQSLEAVG